MLIYKCLILNGRLLELIWEGHSDSDASTKPTTNTPDFLKKTNALTTVSLFQARSIYQTAIPTKLKVRWNLLTHTEKSPQYRKMALYSGDLCVCGVCLHNRRTDKHSMRNENREMFIRRNYRNVSYRLLRRANGEGRRQSSTSWEDRRGNTQYPRVLHAASDRYRP